MSDVEKTIKSVGRSIDRGIHKAGKRIDKQRREFGSDLEGYLKNPMDQFREDTKQAGEMIIGKPPVPEEPTIVPIPDEKTAEIEARRRRARAQSSGRQSTILTDGLGG